MRRRKTDQTYINHGSKGLMILAKKQALLDISESINEKQQNETYCFVGRRSEVLLLSKYPEQILTI